jgi:hypothetical protein
LPKLLAALTFIVLSALLVACSERAAAPPAAPEVVEAPAGDGFSVGRPQNRTGIGDVDRAFARYEGTRADLIAKFQAQEWFKDGLSRDEALFVERSVTFVASYEGPRRSAYVSDQTIERKLYRYEKLALSQGELELLLIFEPNQNGDAQMKTLTHLVTALEKTVGVQYPERVMTVINGAFEINDFNDGQFIRIARCCTQSAFVLAHELAHTYWSMGPAWFNEGMADVYAIMTIERLNSDGPAGWRASTADLDGYYRTRKNAVDSGRFPDVVLSRRLASDGLYEAADVFLLDIRRLLGPEAFLAAARDIYLTSDFGRVNLRDKRIEDVFLARVKDGARGEIMALFNRLIWGDNGERYQQLKDLEGS